MTVFKPKYASWADITIGLASLASDTNLLAGRESAAVDNSANLYLDAVLAGKIRAGTSPTASRQIEIWLYGQVGSTPDYPDALDGTDSNETLTSADIKLAMLRNARIITTANVSDRDYWFWVPSVAGLFPNGILPQRWGVFVVHNTGVALNATAGNHVVRYQGVQVEGA